MANNLSSANTTHLAANVFQQAGDVQLERVHLRVRNAERIIGFFQSVLGLHAIGPDGGPIELRGTPGGRALLLLTEDPRASSRNPSLPGLFHCAFLLPSRPALAAVVKRVLQNRWPIQGFADHGVSEAVYLADPEGNGVELYVDKPMSQWPSRDGRLDMVTEPLDVKNLLESEPSGKAFQASQTAPLSVGHVHLQVSDLGKAERFYHGVLGLDVTQRNFPGALFFSAGGYHHHIGVNTWNSRGAKPMPDNRPGLIGFTMRFGGAMSAEGTANRARTASLTVDLGEDGYLLRDPDAIKIELPLH